MNSVLSDILATGTTQASSGDMRIKVHGAISARKGEFLQRLVRELDPTVTLEVGLAQGISALFICDALKRREGTQHYVIDPNQYGGPWGDSWDGIGMSNLQRAGHDDIVRLLEMPSYRALPQLECSGQQLDFAFIDGWHTFDFTLVDFFYIDRMLRVGGIVVFDDADWRAVRKVCRFVRTNMAYEVIESSPESSLKRRAARLILRHTPLREVMPPESDEKAGLSGACIAFRKKAHDSRRWDHFAEF